MINNQEEHIILLDPLNRNTSHVYFNASVIKGLVDTDKSIRFISKKSHFDQLNHIIDHRNSITLNNESYLGGCIMAILELLKTSSFKRNHIVLLAYDNTAIPLLLLFFFPLLGTNKFSFIIHNNLQTITSNSVKRKLHQFLIKIYKGRPIVLTKYMLKKYKLNFKNSSVVLFKHPNYRGLLKFKKIDSLSREGRTTITIIGRQANLLKEFIEVTDFSKWENIDFVISSKEIRRESNDNLFVYKDRLSFDEYYSILDLSDFCLFANDNSVLNRASGILMDCISLSCPIISSNEGHFNEFSEFNIGFNYTSYDEIPKVFDSIQNHNYKRDNFQRRFIQAQEYSNFDKTIFLND